MSDLTPQADVVTNEAVSLPKEPPLPGKPTPVMASTASLDDVPLSRISKTTGPLREALRKSVSTPKPVGEMKKDLVESDDLPLSRKVGGTPVTGSAGTNSTHPIRPLKDVNLDVMDNDDHPLSPKCAPASKSPMKLGELPNDCKDSDDLPLTSKPVALRFSRTGGPAAPSPARLTEVAADSDDLPLSAVTASKLPSPLRLGDLKSEVGDSDDLPLSSKKPVASPVTNLKIVTDAVGDSDDIPLSKSTTSPLPLTPARLRKQPSEDASRHQDNQIDSIHRESATTGDRPRSRNSTSSRDAQYGEIKADTGKRHSTADKKDLEEKASDTTSTHSTRKRSYSRTNSTHPIPNSADSAYSSAIEGGSSTSRSSAPSIYGSQSGIFGKASAAHLNDPAVRAIALTVSKVILAQFEPWMVETSKTVKELEKTVSVMQARADEIEAALNTLTSTTGLKNVVPQIFKTAPKPPSPTKTPTGQFMNASDLKKDVPSPTIMKNIPTAYTFTQSEGPLLGNLERKIQEENISKVAGSLIYKTIVKEKEAKGDAVEEAARKISGMPGMRGEGTADATEISGIEPVPVRRMCHRCEAFGFTHPRSEIPSCALGVRCINCMDCDSCDGKGIISLTPKSPTFPLVAGDSEVEEIGEAKVELDNHEPQEQETVESADPVEAIAT
ncbi:hypothetical protein HDU67_004899 [Dinochytrium kinnereticum]|nr:hypothetical protein HDU67_004899 [Dinochytrium kinnereticum]